MGIKLSVDEFNKLLLKTGFNWYCNFFAVKINQIWSNVYSICILSVMPI